MEFKLSPSNLNLLEECPRCFWLQMVKKIRRPSGPMSSIPIKMDSIIKHYFNKYRNLGQLPPIIEGKVTGWLAVDMPKTLKHGMSNGITLRGRPDEYLKLEDNKIVALDHKTKSKEPDDIHPSYQLQLNVYSFLLKAMDYETSNKAYLAFYYPDECDLHIGMPFNCKVIEVKTNPSKIHNLVDKAITILNGEIPEHSENCEYCKWNLLPLDKY
ncbi:MAG: PD-(D/E)XK nuclease family protein [Candidatus Hodarchaeota archaeon]